MIYDESNVPKSGMLPDFVSGLRSQMAFFESVGNMVTISGSNSWQVLSLPTGPSKIGYPSVPSSLWKHPHKVASCFETFFLVVPNALIRLVDVGMPLFVIAIPTQEGCLNTKRHSSKHNA